MKTGLYIHIPFCKSKCNYCDFSSFPLRENLIDEYLTALEHEATQYHNFPCKTLYIGGGTPSLLLTNQLLRLGEIITKYFGPISRFEESTFECNPESVSIEKLHVLKELGFNRISMGLQAADDTHLKILGRIHSLQTFEKAYQNIQDAHFKNINIDLIAGIPQQTMDSFVSGVKYLTQLKPTHISIYGLQIEEGTPFFEQGIVCDQILMRKMLEFTHNYLNEQGYHHYEISNFSLPGNEAKHNTNYWNNGDYIGLGSAATSYLNGVRKTNITSIEKYIHFLSHNQEPTEYQEKLEGIDLEGEKMFLGLRKLDGIVPTEIQWHFFGKEIEKHIKNGLLELVDKKLKLTFEGLFLANEVFYSFVAPFE